MHGLSAWLTVNNLYCCTVFQWEVALCVLLSHSPWWLTAAQSSIPKMTACFRDLLHCVSLILHCPSVTFSPHCPWWCLVMQPRAPFRR